MLLLGKLINGWAIFDSCLGGRKGGGWGDPLQFMDNGISSSPCFFTTAVTGTLQHKLGSLYLSGARYFVCLRFAHCLLGLACPSSLPCPLFVESPQVCPSNLHLNRHEGLKAQLE